VRSGLPNAITRVGGEPGYVRPAAIAVYTNRMSFSIRDGVRTAREKAAWLQVDDVAFDRAERLRVLAKETGWPLAQYALAWVLSRPGVSAVVAGARRVGQLEENLRVLGLFFPEEHQGRIDEISPPPPQREDPVRGH